MSPSAEAGAPNVDVSRLGSRAVGISCPASAKKLAVPIPRTPAFSQWSVGPLCSVVDTAESLHSPPRPFAEAAQQVRWEREHRSGQRPVGGHARVVPEGA